MPRAPLRTAFWALSSSIGLSLALLAVSSFSERTQLPPPASLTSGGPVDSSPENAGGPPLSGDADIPAHRTDDEPETVPETVIVADPPSVPVNVVSHPEESGLAIGLEEVLNPVSGSGVFIELPPPPEYDAAAAESPAPEKDLALDELVARIQTNFDDLHRELGRLHQQFAGMQGQFTDELTAVQSSHGEMRRALTELVAAADSRDASPLPVEIDLTVLVMPLRGEARDGALALMSRRLADVRPSVSPAAADHVLTATSTSTAATLKDWLQLHGPARFERQSTLRIEPQSTATIDLSLSTVRGMIQARGTQLHERTLTLPWDGALTIRAAATSGGLVNLEWQVTGNEWRRADLSPGGTLILTAFLGEVYRPVDGLVSVAETVPTPAASTRSVVAEIVALLEPRVMTAPAAAPPRDVAAPFPLLNDGPATR